METTIHYSNGAEQSRLPEHTLVVRQRWLHVGLRPEEGRPVQRVVLVEVVPAHAPRSRHAAHAHATGTGRHWRHAPATSPVTTASGCRPGASNQRRRWGAHRGPGAIRSGRAASQSKARSRAPGPSMGTSWPAGTTGAGVWGPGAHGWRAQRWVPHRPGATGARSTGTHWGSRPHRRPRAHHWGHGERQRSVGAHRAHGHVVLEGVYSLQQDHKAAVQGVRCQVHGNHSHRDERFARLLREKAWSCKLHEVFVNHSLARDNVDNFRHFLTFS